MPARRLLPPLALAASCLAALGCGSTGTTAAGATSVTTAASVEAPTTATTQTAATGATPSGGAAPSATTTTTAPAPAPKDRACGRIAVPSTEAHATVTLRGPALPCATVRRVVRTAYGRTVLLAAPRTMVRDAGRAFRCRYTPSSGAMVCDAPGRRLRGTI